MYSYPNRRTYQSIYCPAVERKVNFEIISHSDTNYFKSRVISRDCCYKDECPFKSCRCKYDDGVLVLED